VQLSHGTAIEQLANGSHTGHGQALGGMIGAADASPLHCGMGCSHARLWLRNEKRENGCAAAAAASFPAGRRAGSTEGVAVGLTSARWNRLAYQLTNVRLERDLALCTLKLSP
jgi:hypothetical protein